MARGVDFVMLFRGTTQDELYALPPAEFTIMMKFIIEADYKTGVVKGSARSLSQMLNMERNTYARHVKSLQDRGLIEVVEGKNRYDLGEVRIVRYAAFAHSSGGGSGGGSGSEPAPLERADQQRPHEEATDKTQDSVLSVHSLVPSIAHSALPAQKPAATRDFEKQVQNITENKLESLAAMLRVDPTDQMAEDFLAKAKAWSRLRRIALLEDLLTIGEPRVWSIAMHAEEDEDRARELIAQEVANAA